MADDKYATAWTEDVEDGLVKMVSQAPPLWTIRREEDVKDAEMLEFFRLLDPFNKQFNRRFTAEMLAKKWLEIRLLFDLKYAMNGYSMADRGHECHRDGTLKDDLTQSWRHFDKLAFLVDPEAGQRKRVVKK